MTHASATLQALRYARAVADHAEQLGVLVTAASRRAVVSHIGAVLADAVLQPGLNYRTVVSPRVERIKVAYPSAARLAGVRELLASGLAGEFLDWRHDVKVGRLVRLVELLYGDQVECVRDLRAWLGGRDTRRRLLDVNGFGPKSYDYMCCLVGLDHVAVDRHVRAFVGEAGIRASGYEELRMVVSYAADLLGMPRRDFDAWIWRRSARHTSPVAQLVLL